MDINLGDSITKMVNEISKRYEVATTKCVIELINKVGFQMSDKPIEEEIVRIASELNNNGYRFEINQQHGLTSSIDLYYKANFVARCEIEM